jgi:hypothetical protein
MTVLEKVAMCLVGTTGLVGKTLCRGHKVLATPLVCPDLECAKQTQHTKRDEYDCVVL